MDCCSAGTTHVPAVTSIFVFMAGCSWVALPAQEELIRFERQRDTPGISMRTRGMEHSNIEKAAQFERVVRVLKFAERLGLDLPDAFAGH